MQLVGTAVPSAKQHVIPYIAQPRMYCSALQGAISGIIELCHYGCSARLSVPDSSILDKSCDHRVSLVSTRGTHDEVQRGTQQGSDVKTHLFSEELGTDEALHATLHCYYQRDGHIFL